MKFIRNVFLLSLFNLIGTMTVQGQHVDSPTPSPESINARNVMGPMEPDTNRPGGADFSNFDLREADPKLCEAACAGNAECRAWTYAKPNTVHGPRPHCWLKKQIAAKRSDECCISGIVISDMGGAPVVASTTPAEPPVCDRARKAQARNSPAAPGLAAQCRAAGGTIVETPQLPRSQPSQPPGIRSVGRTQPWYQISEWSAWTRDADVEYRYRWGWNVKDSRDLDAIFQIRNTQREVWKGKAGSLRCSENLISMSKGVVIQPNETQEVKFRTQNCGTKDKPSFQPIIVKSVRID